MAMNLHNEVKELTGGKIQLTEGALYPTLHAMEAQGILTTDVVNVGNRITKVLFRSLHLGKTISQRQSE
jgi:PadR family transcriptional regulator, regulatory protein PadR